MLRNIAFTTNFLIVDFQEYLLNIWLRSSYCSKRMFTIRFLTIQSMSTCFVNVMKQQSIISFRPNVKYSLLKGVTKYTIKIFQKKFFLIDCQYKVSDSKAGRWGVTEIWPKNFQVVYK